MYITHIYNLDPLQVFVVRYQYYPIESDENIQVCLQTNRVVTESVNIHVQTTHTSNTGYTPAIGKTDI